MPIDFFSRRARCPRYFQATLLQGVGTGLLIALGLISCSEEKAPDPGLSAEDRIQQMIASEELLQKLTPNLRALGASMISGSREDLPEAVAGEAAVAPWKELNPSHRWTSASFGTLAASFQGKVYDIVSSIDLSTPVDQWEVFETYSNILATFPTNTVVDGTLVVSD